MRIWRPTYWWVIRPSANQRLTVCSLTLVKAATSATVSKSSTGGAPVAALEALPVIGGAPREETMDRPAGEDPGPDTLPRGQ